MTPPLRHSLHGANRDARRSVVCLGHLISGHGRGWSGAAHGSRRVDGVLGPRESHPVAVPGEQPASASTSAAP